MTENNLTHRYFSTYSGVKLPLNLLSELTDADITNRNTYFKAYYDAQDRMVICEKLVYGDVELKHCYEYDDAGNLKQTEITDADGEVDIITN